MRSAITRPRIRSATIDCTAVLLVATIAMKQVPAASNPIEPWSGPVEDPNSRIDAP